MGFFNASQIICTLQQHMNHTAGSDNGISYFSAFMNRFAVQYSGHACLHHEAVLLGQAVICTAIEHVWRLWNFEILL